MLTLIMWALIKYKYLEKAIEGLNLNPSFRQNKFSHLKTNYFSPKYLKKTLNHLQIRRILNN
jgi:hypothetical protein